MWISRTANGAFEPHTHTHTHTPSHWHSQPRRTMWNKWAINEYREATANWSCVFNWFAYLSLLLLVGRLALLLSSSPPHTTPTAYAPLSLKGIACPLSDLCVALFMTALSLVNDKQAWFIYRLQALPLVSCSLPVPNMPGKLSSSWLTTEGANELGFGPKLLENFSI